jgi:hypothetical protein
VTIFPFIITRSAGSGFLAQEKKRLMTERPKTKRGNLRDNLFDMIAGLLRKWIYQKRFIAFQKFEVK